jgi:hypothetical protein
MDEADIDARSWYPLARTLEKGLLAKDDGNRRAVVPLHLSAVPDPTYEVG